MDWSTWCENVRSVLKSLRADEYGAMSEANSTAFTFLDCGHKCPESLRGEVVTLIAELRATVRKCCTDDISRPGKMEGNPVYAPWFYHCAFVAGFGESTEDDDNAELVDVEPVDRFFFPELVGVDCLRLWESDQGFFYVADQSTHEQ